MKRITILAAAMILAGVAAVKLYLPDNAADRVDAAANILFPGDSAVVSILTRELAEPVSAPQGVTTVEYCPVVNIPAAVGVFLDAQKQYADLELPATATYDYISPPAGWVNPVAGYRAGGFGYRMHPIDREVAFHSGTDIPAWTGDSIRCFLPGTVTETGCDDIYGNYAVVSHDGGWESLYAHCDRLLVEDGQTLEAGEKLALVGSTGKVTGPHLHFELRHDGINVNPEYYINSL